MPVYYMPGHLKYKVINKLIGSAGSQGSAGDLGIDLCSDHRVFHTREEISVQRSVCLFPGAAGRIATVQYSAVLY